MTKKKLTDFFIFLYYLLFLELIIYALLKAIVKFRTYHWIYIYIYIYGVPI